VSRAGHAEHRTLTQPHRFAGALESLLAGEDERLVASSHEPAHRADLREIPAELHDDVKDALERVGISNLFSHQEDAWRSVMGAGHTIVTTSTASGKSLCFNLPVLHMLSCDRRARALYLYPTKALAQDQARSLSALGPPALRNWI
jgi:DEAD/DEAH box helicase domain-containing protein